MPRKRRGSWLLPLIIVLVVIAAAAAAAYFLLTPKTEAQSALENTVGSYQVQLTENYEGPEKLIADKYAELFNIEIETDAEESFRSASALVKLSYLNVAALTKDLAPEMQALLEGYVAEARVPGEIYAEDDSFLPEIQEKAYEEALEGRLEKAADYMSSSKIRLEYMYEGGSWQLINGNDLLSFATMPRIDMPGFAEAAAQLEYVDFRFRLDDWTSPGPVPNPACYGETDDPAVVAALLETSAARKLINGQQLDWSPDKELIPGSTIHYYLDDSILSIVWQEEEHGAIGTFAETFISDASQLRRKLADDNFGGMTYYYPTTLAAQSNAVTAVSGDFYDLPNRVYGLYVYNGRLLRSCLYAGQSCLIDDQGNMNFTYENQFATEEEAQKYIDEHNIMFSLSFGPVIMDHGVDVTPDNYPLGEVLDTYARCVIGQLGERHYLAMTINVRVPDYNVYVTLRQAADSIIAHGCYNAYTLDGGQTGSIIIGNELINPVQFGYEREQSDIFYFASAIPND